MILHKPCDDTGRARYPGMDRGPLRDRHLRFYEIYDPSDRGLISHMWAMHREGLTRCSFSDYTNFMRCVTRQDEANLTRGDYRWLLELHERFHPEAE